MSVTLTWYLILVPDAFDQAISKEFELARKTAQKCELESMSVIEKWEVCPESFGWHMLACEISDRHIYYDTWIDINELQAFFSLFNRKEFESLFFKYMTFCGPNSRCGVFEVAEVVVTHRDTAPAVLFQAIGNDALKELPGFFGNFYIRKDNLKKELERYNNLLVKQGRSILYQRGTEFYNAPCNNKEDNQVVEEIVNALPKAIKYAIERKCGLLGLVVTAG